MIFADHILQYFDALEKPKRLPKGIDVLFPFDSLSVRHILSQFYIKYYNDTQTRHLILGINPGRLGAGLTGVAFTDPYHLESHCDIPNKLNKKKELSSILIYELIDHMGGPYEFYSKFFISSVCPVGFTKEGINYNYYDDVILEKRIEKYIVNHLNDTLKMNLKTEVCFILGKGKNLKSMRTLNDKYGFFDELIPLPHPRWILQYQRKNKTQILDDIILKLQSV